MPAVAVLGLPCLIAAVAAAALVGVELGTVGVPVAGMQAQMGPRPVAETDFGLEQHVQRTLTVSWLGLERTG